MLLQDKALLGLPLVGSRPRGPPPHRSGVPKVRLRLLLVLVIIVVSSFGALLTVPPVVAQTPSSDVPAPQELVVTSAHPVRYQTAAGGQVQFDVYLNFTRSTADTGSGTYDLCWFYVVSNSSGICLRNTTVADIPGRTSWVTIHHTGSTQLSDQGQVPRTWGNLFLYNVSLNKSTYGGLPTDGVMADVLGIGTSNQTGNITLAAPGIVNVQVVSQSNETQAGQTMLTFIQSASDPKANSTGDFTYDVLEQFSTTATQRNVLPEVASAFGCSSLSFISGLCRLALTPFITAVTGKPTSIVVTPGTTSFILVPTAPGAGLNGYRFFNVTYGGNLSLAPFLLTLDVTAVDNLTGLIGQTSCQTTLDPTLVGFSGTCGIFTRTQVNVPAQGTPGLPGLDGVAFATAVGLPQENVGWIFAGILMLGLFILGWAVGRGVGAGALAIVGVAFSYSLNLVQAWVLVVVFALSMVVIVYFRRGAGD